MPPLPEKRWAWRKVDQSKLREFFHGTNELPTHGEATQEAEAIDRLLGEACDACMPKITYRGGKKPVR